MLKSQTMGEGSKDVRRSLGASYLTLDVKSLTRAPRLK